MNRRRPDETRAREKPARRLPSVPFLVLLAAAAPAAAHDGELHAIGWSWSPLIVVPLGLLAIAYATGLKRLWRRAAGGQPALRRGALLFAAGWASLAGALVSPLHEAGESSFAMHMIEHEIIMLLSALLLAASRPGGILVWAFPPAARRALGGIGRWRVWRVVADPFVATALQAAAIVAWHMPSLFDRTLESDAWHVAQHLCFIATAILFWWAMLRRAAWPAAAACLLATSIVGGGLGALMAFSASPWYDGYAALNLTPTGLTPDEDQQLAGLLMWVPGGLWHMAAALAFVARGLRGAGTAGAPVR